jgi:nitric oxide reductase large subunit
MALPCAGPFLAPEEGMRVRAVLYVVAIAIVGAVIFMGSGVATILSLFNEHCGPAFGWYGCDIRTANINVAERRDGRRLAQRRPKVRVGE